MESYSDGLEAIASYLSGYSEFPIIPRNSPSSSNIIGTICAALFPDDNEWYRAKILSETDKGFEVLFIDFGNTTITSEARIISDVIANAPYLSKKCCLRMPNNILEWSQKAEDKFVEISASGESVFTIELIKPGDAAIVDLILDGTSLIDILKPLCEENVNVKPGGLNDALSISVMTMSTLSDMGGGNEELDSVVISHVNSPIDFYVQLNSEVNDLETVTDKLFDVTEKLENPKIGEICAALYPKDDNYYRAKILSKEADDSYNVLYIDFGNCSLTNDFKHLPDDLKVIPHLAKHVSLAGVGFDLGSENVIEKFNEILEPFYTENVDMIVLDKKIEPWVIKLNLNGEDICDKLKMELGFAVNMNESINLEEKFIDIIISHIVSVNEFYIQMENEIDQVENITNQLENHNEMEEIKESIDENETYAALFDEDEFYYRAKIINSPTNTENEKEVFFIDFGNTAKSKLFKKLPNELKSIKNMATKCSLLIEDNKVNYENFNEKFLKYMDLHFGEKFSLELIEEVADQPWKVKLYNKDVNMYDEIVKMCETKDESNDENVIISYKKCTISHFNSPNDFYIQMSDDDGLLDDVSDKLEMANEFKKFDDFKIGDICAAKFDKDGAYYRAKILLLGAENGATVIYTDFGNEAFTDDIRELTDELKIIKPLSKRCTLENPNNINFESIEAIECFTSIIEEHFNETFQIYFVKDNTDKVDSLEKFSNDIDPAIVKLDFQNINIYETLIDSIKAKTHPEEQKNKENKNITNDILNDIIDITKTNVTKTNEAKNIINDVIDETVNNSETVSGLINDVINLTVNDENSEVIRDSNPSTVKDTVLKCDETASNAETVSSLINDVINLTVNNKNSEVKQIHIETDPNPSTVKGIVDDIIDTTVITNDIIQTIQSNTTDAHDIINKLVDCSIAEDN